MVHLSFSELPTSAFIPLYCAIVRPNLEHAIEDISPTLRIYIIDLDRAQRPVARLVRDHGRVLYKTRFHHLNLFSLEYSCTRADLSLTSKIFKGVIDLSLSDVFLRLPRVGLRGRTAVRFPRVSLNTGFSSHVTLSVCLKTVNGPTSFLKHMRNLCSPSPTFSPS